jgi:C4-dicarboxylate-specific signal transduction histidine kinase
VVRTHQFVLARRHGNWDVLETATLKRAKAELKGHNEELERRVAERTSELMKASEALREAQAELARATRLTAMGELTASIAHELKQPLAGAVANSDACLAWLSSQPPNLEEARAAADHMIEAATRASHIIGGIQALFRKAAPERTKVNINEVIEETLGLIRGDALRNNVSLQTELGSRLPPVLGDRVQLQQMVLNLVMNGIEAIRTLDDRTRQLRIRSARDEANQVVVAIADSGPGIDPQVVGRIFEPFYTTKPQGTGMGLAISRSIIEAHGGRLWAEPNTPRGATFQCTLPASIESVQ